MIPRVAHDRFLLNPFQLICHVSMSLHGLNIDGVVKWPTKKIFFFWRGSYNPQDKQGLFPQRSLSGIFRVRRNRIQETLDNPVTFNPDRNMKNSVHSWVCALKDTWNVGRQMSHLSVQTKRDIFKPILLLFKNKYNFWVFYRWKNVLSFYSF
jgi:hypothetical protein